jgi:two-component sensor histidine kinase
MKQSRAAAVGVSAIETEIDMKKLVFAAAIVLTGTSASLIAMVFHELPTNAVKHGALRTSKETS